MADENDVRALLAGDPDMVRRDFRGADLRGVNATDRDFTGARFDGAKLQGGIFAGSIFKSSHLVNIEAEHAQFNQAKLSQAPVVSANLRYANLREAKVMKSILANADFTGADLVGADFSNSKFQENTTFADCIVNETTKFDGAELMRPLASQPAFRFYKVERGILIRKTPEELAGIEQPAYSGEINAIVKTVNEVLASLAPLRPIDEPPNEVAGMGHNNPPEDTPVDAAKYSELETTLREVRAEVVSAAPGSAVIEAKRSRIAAFAFEFGEWLKPRTNLAADEFAKQFGKSTADYKIWLGAWMVMTGKLELLQSLLTNFLRSIGH